MERQLDNEFKYIPNISIDELEKTVHEKDIEYLEKYKERIFSGDKPLIGENYDKFLAKIFTVTGNLIPESLKEFLEELPTEKRKTFTYNDLKEMGLDITSPTREDIIRFFGHKDSIVFDKLTDYFRNQKHVELERNLDYDVIDRMMVLYVHKEIDCSELLEIIKSVKLEQPMQFKNSEERCLLESFLNSLSAKERKYLIPQDVLESQRIERELNNFSYGLSMHVMRSITGFTNLTLDTIDDLSKYLKDKKCLEICSGAGLLAHLLQEKGIDVIPTDVATKEDNGYTALRIENFTDVKHMDGVKAIKTFDADVLIMAWPPYQSSIASDALNTFFEKNPNGQILYVGEWENGCTADYDFFESIKERGLNCTYLNLDYKPLEGIHDAFYMISK